MTPMQKALLPLLLLVLPALLSAQEAESQRTLTVSAQGIVERAPDQAMLVLAVESEAPSAQAAAQDNAPKMERVVAALRSVGIPAAAMRTTGYDLQPVYARPDQNNQPPRIASYRAVNRLQVTIDRLELVGPALDGAVAAGANRAENLYFQLKDPSAARLEALQLATDRARSEAEAVATAAGETLGLILSIQTDSYSPQPPRPVEFARAVAMDAMQAQTPVQAGTLSVTASVTIVYRLGG